MQTPGESGVTADGRRFKLGLVIFVLAFAIWLLMPLAVALNVSGTTLAALSGIIFISNKVLLLAVVAVMGKPGFQHLKRHVLGYVTVLAPASDVGPLRHSLGLVMFGLPLFTTFLEPYDDYIWPALLTHSWQVELLSDLIFIASFFVLGGNFWDKIRALFVRTARVVDLGGNSGADTAASSPILVSAMPRSRARSLEEPTGFGMRLDQSLRAAWRTGTK